MTKYVVGLFETREAAERVVRELHGRGLDRTNVSVAMRHPGDAAAVADATGAQTTEAAGAGAVGGGILGGLAGLLVGLGALTVPGVGPVLAAGPLSAALGTTLAGAGIGAAAGGLVGALVGMGVPEEEAEYYSEGIRRGGILVTVLATETQADMATSIMRSNGALDVEADLRRGRWASLGAESAPVPEYREEVGARYDRAATPEPGFGQPDPAAHPAHAPRAAEASDEVRRG